MKTDAKNVSALCHAYDIGKAEGLRVAKEKYLDADAYNEGIADGRASAIEECKQILLDAMARDGKTKCHEYMVAINEMERLN